VQLSGTTNSVTMTDGQGNFRFAGLPGGNLTLTASKGDYGFTPASRSFINLTVSVTNISFAGVFTSDALPGKIAFNPRISLATRSLPSTMIVNDDGSGIQSPLFEGLLENLTDFEHAWTKDGRKLAFGRSQFGKTQIFTVNADGTGLENVSASTNSGFAPSWSPDGTKIAFIEFKHDPVFNRRIVVMKADGSDRTTLTNHVSFTLSGTWSPDGTRIAYAFPVTISFPGRIRTFKVDGTDERIIATSINEEIQNVAWSPEGSRFAYVSTRLTNSVRSYFVSIVSTNGGVPSLSIPRQASGGAVAWSPDGTRIAYGDGTNGITTIKTDGTDKRRLNADGFIGSHSWGPTATFPTPIGEKVEVGFAGTSVTFSEVETSGVTTIATLSTATAPLPSGYFAVEMKGMGLTAYEIRTTADYTAPITVCFTLTNVLSEKQFSALRILHGEDGVLVDRTILSPDSPAPNFAAKTICARVSSLSPFVIAELLDPLLPQIGGAVINTEGLPLGSVPVALLGDVERTTTTDINGEFRFPNLGTNENYTVSVPDSRFLFSPAEHAFEGLAESASVLFLATNAPLPDMPLLLIGPDPDLGNAPSLSWTGNLFDFELESVDSMSSTNWVPAPDLLLPGSNRVVVPLFLEGDERYFRLRRP
jgi:Tol biopolymer transport system component